MASTHILATGIISGGGEIEWCIAPPLIEQEEDGLLQQLIDEAEMTEDYESWLDDQEWHRRGC